MNLAHRLPYVLIRWADKFIFLNYYCMATKCIYLYIFADFPDGSLPESGRSPRGGNDNPLQCSCLGNPVDRMSLVGFHWFLRCWCLLLPSPAWPKLSTRPSALREQEPSSVSPGHLAHGLAHGRCLVIIVWYDSHCREALQFDAITRWSGDLTKTFSAFSVGNSWG